MKRFRLLSVVFVILLYLNSILTVLALGPVMTNVQRSDGLCNTFALPLKVYNCEELVVQTDDQFLLGVQRLSRRGYDGVLKGPVLLLHGILLGGDIWFLNDPDDSLAFVLAGAGYDVWIGNTRTTRFSYGHVLYSKVDKGFWEWSVDELAAYDLPAMLGLVQMQTNKRVHFVPYSQGSQQTFVAFSQGQLVDVLDKVVILAPIAYVNDVSASIAKLAARFYVDRLYEAFHIYEFSTQFRYKEVADIICAPGAQRCFNTYVSLFTGDNCCINYTRRPIFDEYETQPTATKNLAHLAQQFRRKTFAKFDYGIWGNLMRYRWPFPPAYDLSRVPTNNLFFIHGGKDTLSDVQDVRLLLSQLSGQFPVTLIPQYAHLDFVLGTNAKQVVYDQVIKYLES